MKQIWKREFGLIVKILDIVGLIVILHWLSDICWKKAQNALTEDEKAKFTFSVKAFNEMEKSLIKIKDGIDPNEKEENDIERNN